MTTAAPARTDFELSVVTRMDVRPDGSSDLVLRPPSLQETVLRLPTVPDVMTAGRAVHGRGRALAVRIDQSDGDVACSVLCATGGGPERLRIPLAAALALCQEGRHTVVTRRRAV